MIQAHNVNQQKLCILAMWYQHCRQVWIVKIWHRRANGLNIIVKGGVHEGFDMIYKGELGVITTPQNLIYLTLWYDCLGIL